MKRGSDVGSRQKRSSNEADELCATPFSFQLTVTSKTWRTPAMNGARNGPTAEIAFGVRYQFLNGMNQPDPSGSPEPLRLEKKTSELQSKSKIVCRLLVDTQNK